MKKDTSTMETKEYENEDIEDSFVFLKNIKIESKDSSTLGKLCCTSKYLFVSTTGITSKIYIFNYSSLHNLKKERIDTNEEEIEEKNKNNKDKKWSTNEDTTHEFHLNTLLNLEDGYIGSPQMDQKDFLGSLKEEAGVFNYKEPTGNTVNTYSYKESFCNINNQMDEITKEKKEKGKSEHGHDRMLKICNERSGLHEFREEYLYYDDFYQEQKSKENTKVRKDQRNLESEEEEYRKKEREEEVQKRKKIEQDKIKEENLQKKGYHIDEDTLHIQEDVLRRKHINIENTIEYIGSFIDIPSSVLLMKVNSNETILSVLTCAGAIITYNISDEHLNKLKGKREHRIRIFSNFDLFLQNFNELEGEIQNRNDPFSTMDASNGYGENYLDDEEETPVSPLSVYDSYFVSSIKHFDFIEDDILVCVGMNQEYFLSFHNCKTGKHIIYNKRMRIKKSNPYETEFTLLHDFISVHVDKSQMTFTNEDGHFVYIGTSNGYLICTFISTHFLSFVKTLLASPSVETNAVFSYSFKMEQDNENILECIDGNLDQLYRVKKSEIYTLFDKNTRSTLFSPSRTVQIFKTKDQKIFTYAFCISRKVRIENIVRVSCSLPGQGTDTSEKIRLLLGTNKGKVFYVIFKFNSNISNDAFKGSFPTVSTNWTPLHQLEDRRKAQHLTKSDYSQNLDNEILKNEETSLNEKVPSSLESVVECYERKTLDLRGFHKSAKIQQLQYLNMVKQKDTILINCNLKKMGEQSDGLFYTTHSFNLSNERIKRLYDHKSCILDSCVSSLYFCLDNKNTIAVFVPSTTRCVRTI